MLLREFLSVYGGMMARRPYPTGMTTSLTLWSTGDLIAQFLDMRNARKAGKEKSLDVERTLRTAFFGAFVFAPFAINWYGLVQRMFPKQTLNHIVQKVFWDQTAWASLVTTSFLSYSALAEGKSWDVAKKRVQDNYWDTMKANWAIWPAVQIVNLNFVPPLYRILVVNSVAIPWNTYLAWVANK